MKKNQKQSSQILSPENYIRQRARNLPIHKCTINDNWEESGLGNVTLSRKHINGNITFCSYLVDLKCLGIKDTLYVFNVPEYEYDEYIDELETKIDLVECDYTLAHNIIHAGWEYAEEIGFKPHKDFLSITQYMLDEDNDDIPLIEIACGGKDGKPLFIQGPFEDDGVAKTIINRLERTVGKDNFNFILGGNDPAAYADWEEDEYDDEYDDEDSEEDMDAIYNEYVNNSYEENVRLFLELTKQLEEETSDDLLEREDPLYIKGDINRIHVLTDLLYDEIVDPKKLRKWINKWRDEEEEYTITNAAFYHLLGLKNEEEVTYEDLSFVSKEEDEARLLEYIRERWGELPFEAYLNMDSIDDPVERKEEINRLLTKYPDYAIVRVEEKIEKIHLGKLKKSELSYKSTFGNRKEITPLEYVKWQMMKIYYFLALLDLNAIEAMTFMNDSEKRDEYTQINVFFSMLFIMRISALRVFLLKS